MEKRNYVTSFRTPSESAGGPSTDQMIEKTAELFKEPRKTVKKAAADTYRETSSAADEASDRVKA